MPPKREPSQAFHIFCKVCSYTIFYVGFDNWDILIEIRGVFSVDFILSAHKSKVGTSELSL